MCIHMRVLLNEVIVTSAEKIVTGVRKLEVLVSKGLQSILKAQKEAHSKFIIAHRAKHERRFAEAHKEIKEILANAHEKANRLDLMATECYFDALNKRCKIIDKRNELSTKIRKGL